jgi:ribosomal protein L14
LEALMKICEGTGVHTITCMDVFATEGAQETAASVQDIVRVCCDDLQVKSLSIYEYRGQEHLYRQIVGLIPAYPQYKFTNGHWNGRHIYNMRV